LWREAYAISAASGVLFVAASPAARFLISSFVLFVSIR
jgi:hypothetical protein